MDLPDSLDAVVPLLLGSKLRIAGTVALSVVVVIGAAAGLGVLGVPSVAAVDNEFAGVNNSTTTIETDLVVSNPNPVGITLGDVRIDYTVSMNDVRVATGDREGVSLAPGNSTTELTTQMDNQQIPPWFASHVRNGEQSQLTVDANVTAERLGRSKQFTITRPIQTDLLGQFSSNETRPVRADDSALTGSPLVESPVMYVNETDAEWGAVTSEETPINVDFVAYNPQDYPLTVSSIDYEITMNDVLVGQGSSETNAAIPSEATERVQTRTAITNANLDEWWASHLENDQVTDLQIRFYATVEVEGQSFRVPVRALDHQDTIETHIFEDNAS
ncbi:LEA14-like dessication related protein [Natronoarchaeum philippinense]|uniref:LEA14-like dessication related protein n=1 Tax=Natronoarchaeum philippinense TaxID=558529 RepID=A0A285NUU7_NATPI|nr:LEA type 2 family protein [Natronoarchaeum philippinense]SNZ13219.1 LEA14-like dessication related protein [Natronoarchaeum philippinense]